MNVYCWLITEKCQVLSEQKPHEFVEKVPNQELDKLPEVVISYRLQVFAREKKTEFHRRTPKKTLRLGMGGEPWELLD